MSLPVKRIDDVIDHLIDEIIRVEGGYSDDPNDAGGKTKFGITEAVARANGYTGDMKDLPEAFAKQIYFKQYVIDPGFDQIVGLAPRLAAELVDTGVNCGPATPGKFLQRALNMFNQGGKSWPDLVVDGGIGPRTMECLREFLAARKEGEAVMLFALNAMQFCYYEDISVKRPANEAFTYGWALNRGWLQLLAAANPTA